MSPFLFLSLLFLPLFNAERIQTGFDNTDDLLMQRSVAASYLCMYLILNSIVSFFFLLFFSWYANKTISTSIIGFTN